MNSCMKRYFSGQIRVVNESNIPIWVNDIAGFKLRPVAGIIIPGTGKTTIIDRIPIPEAIFIEWWPDKDNSNNYDIDDKQIEKVEVLFPSTKNGKGKILIVFTKKLKWIVKIEK